MTAAQALGGAALATGAAKNTGALAVAMYKAGANFSPKIKRDAKTAADGKCQDCRTETTPGQKSP